MQERERGEATEKRVVIRIRGWTWNVMKMMMRVCCRDCLAIIDAVLIMGRREGGKYGPRKRARETSVRGDGALIWIRAGGRRKGERKSESSGQRN